MPYDFANAYSIYDKKNKKPYANEILRTKREFYFTFLIYLYFHFIYIVRSLTSLASIQTNKIPKNQLKKKQPTNQLKNSRFKLKYIYMYIYICIKMLIKPKNKLPQTTTNKKKKCTQKYISP